MDINFNRVIAIVPMGTLKSGDAFMLKGTLNKDLFFFQSTSY